MATDLPDGWRLRRLGEFLSESRISGSNGRTAKKITVKLYGRGIIARNETHIGSEACRYYRRRAGQFIYSKLDFLNGALGVIPAELNGYESSLDLPCFDIDESIIEARWLVEYVTRPAFYERFRGSADGSRKAKRVYPEDILSFRIPLPPLPEQRAIADILYAMDSTILRTREVIAQLRVAKRTVVGELLTRGTPGKHAHFNNTLIGIIPDTWSVRSIGHTGSVCAGRQRSPHHTQGKMQPYLRVANVFDGYIDTDDVYAMPFTDREYAIYKLEPGDILLNEGQSRELVGRSAVYKGEPKDCCFQNTLIRFRVGESITVEYAQMLFQHLQYTGVFSHYSRQTTSIAHLGVARFAGIQIPLPSIEEQQEIAGFIGSFDKRLNTETAYLEQLTEAKRGLAQGLLSGAITTTQVAKALGY